MKTTLSLPLASLCSLALGCAAQPAPAPATAQAPPGAPAGPTISRLRSPDAILADSVQAMGGAAAWSAHRTVHIKMDLAFQGMAMGGPVDHYQTSADKSLTVSSFPGIGMVREGSNGKVFWAQDPFNGLRYLEGAEAEQARIEDSWNSDLEARTLYAKIETTPDPPAGLECLSLTLRSGPPLRSCYDRQTHLQVSQEGIHATPQGNVPFKATVSDWRSVGGLKMPYTTEMHAGPVIIITTVKEVAFDEPMNDATFEPPSPGAQ
jgi:zinc protease